MNLPEKDAPQHEVTGLVSKRPRSKGLSRLRRSVPAVESTGMVDYVGRWIVIAGFGNTSSKAIIMVLGK